MANLADVNRVRRLLSFAVLAVALLSTSAADAQTGAADELRDPVTFEQISEIDELTGAHADVFRLYWAYFDRKPDAAGAMFWVDQHDQCMGLRQIADFFGSSDEFRSTYGDLTNEEFVDLVYRNVLDRDAEPGGRAFWLQQVQNKTMTRTEVMLNVGLAPEFENNHPLPSDGVPDRPCQPSSALGVVSHPYNLQQYEPFGFVGPVTLHLPSIAVEQIGFHESNHDGAAQIELIDTVVPVMTMETRNRDNVARGAADISVHPNLEIRSPVTGTVIRAGGYTLYCRYSDAFVVIEPDELPGWEVKVLHMTDRTAIRGDRVVAGETVIAAGPNKFPFRSQIDEFTGEPSWGHIHIEVVDPSVPDRPSSGGGC